MRGSLSNPEAPRVPAAERVLQALANLYEGSSAGFSTSRNRDFLVDLRKLLTAAGCLDGDSREDAMNQLRALNGNLIHLEGHRRDPEILHRVRVPLSSETGVFALVGRSSPGALREQLALQFHDASQDQNVPLLWRERWGCYCAALAEATRAGGSIQPFDRQNPAECSEILALLPRLLAWQGESLMRFASCVLCGDSKRLGKLSPRLSLALGRLSGGEIPSLEALGLIENPRFVLVHGPLRLRIGGDWMDLGKLHGPFRIAEADVQAAEILATTANRCLTVENETTFHELAKLRSGLVLICTSYPGRGTLALLQRLPITAERWHFGDSDPAGFDILRDLRQRTGQRIQSLHMRYRASPCGPRLEESERNLLTNLIQSELLAPERGELQRMLDAGAKGAFEQEQLGRPASDWPFYAF